MKVFKTINNNLVKSYNDKNQEVLVMGSGIGFKKKQGEDIDEAAIEKIYTITDVTGQNKLIQILEKVPIEQIQVTNEIINFAKASLGKKLSNNIYVTLTDHINFAVERFESNIPLKNALLWEIKRFYNHEYLIGKEALTIIEQKLGIKLPIDEAGFIAIHFVNASMDSSELSQIKQMTEMIQHILNIVKYHFKVELDEYSIHYERFVTHLKFFTQRVFSDSEIEEEDKSYLFVLKEQYKKEYECALKVRDYILKEYGKDLTEEEMIYITVHIKRVTMNS